MLRDVNVQDAPPIMADDEEAVEYAEGNRWHGKEIHGCNGFPMVSKKGQPALGPVGISRRSFHPTRDGSLGQVKAENEEFPVDPSCSPGWVLGDYTGDQFPNLLRRRSSSHLLPNSGDQPPVHTKACPVLAHDSFRGDQDKRIFPSRPDAPNDYPEELIEQAEDRARMSAFQRDELLAQSKILEKETSPPAKEAAQHSKAEPDEAKHGHDL
jgi:hypothetical protein